MRQQVIVGTYHLNNDILKIIEDHFDGEDIKIQKVDNIIRLQGGDLFSTPDILLIDHKHVTLTLLNDLKNVVYDKKMVIAIVGDSYEQSCVTCNLSYDSAANTLISNNVIKTMANTMRKLKTNHSLNDWDRVNFDVLSEEERIPKKEYLELMKRILAFIEMKDHYTKGHCERTAKYSVFIAHAMALPPSRIKMISAASVIHDVGKIGIPDDILTKNGRLTTVEFEIVKQHTSVIKDLLPEKHFSKIKKIIRAHHERYDGKGYPDGLAFDKISLESKIITIADSFDAMTSNRSYNKVKTLREAKEELVRNRGTQFDPEVAGAFIDIIDTSFDFQSYFENQRMDRGKIK